MSNTFWSGTAPAVAQVSTQTFGTYDASTTRKISIGGTNGAPTVTVSAVDSGGTLTTALTALAVLLNASTNGYFTQITWTSDATHITGTAKTAGVPFTMTGAVSGGTGTVSNSGVQVNSTVSSGPNDWSTAANWSLGVIPANGDTVIFTNNAINCVWGLATGIHPAEVRIDLTYTPTIGIGLGRLLATNADGSGTNATVMPEYRQAYLQFAGVNAVTYSLGQNFGTSNATGTPRIKIDTNNTLATINVYQTAAQPYTDDANLTSIQLLCNDGTNDNLYVMSASGGIGLAIGPGETSAINTVNISDSSTASRVIAGVGANIASWTQYGGTNQLNVVNTGMNIFVYGGALTVNGTAAYNDLFVYGGIAYSNSTGTITSMQVYHSGTINLQRNNTARTVTTLTLRGGTILAHQNITFTTITPIGPVFSVVYASNAS